MRDAAFAPGFPLLVHPSVATGQSQSRTDQFCQLGPWERTETRPVYLFKKSFDRWDLRSCRQKKKDRISKEKTIEIASIIGRNKNIIVSDWYNQRLYTKCGKKITFRIRNRRKVLRFSYKRVRQTINGGSNYLNQNFKPKSCERTKTLIVRYFIKF